MMDIRQRTVDYMQQNFGLSAGITETLFDIGMFREDIARRTLVRDEYARRARTRKKTELKITLAEKYAVSFSTVEKWVNDDNLFP